MILYCQPHDSEHYFDRSFWPTPIAMDLVKLTSAICGEHTENDQVIEKSKTCFSTKAQLSIVNNVTLSNWLRFSVKTIVPSSYGNDLNVYYLYAYSCIHPVVRWAIPSSLLPLPNQIFDQFSALINWLWQQKLLGLNEWMPEEHLCLHAVCITKCNYRDPSLSSHITSSVFVVVGEFVKQIACINLFCILIVGSERDILISRSIPVPPVKWLYFFFSKLFFRVHLSSATFLLMRTIFSSGFRWGPHTRLRFWKTQFQHIILLYLWWATIILWV